MSQQLTDASSNKQVAKKPKLQLRGNGILVLIIFLSMTPPLSSDIYMPGLPMVAQELQTSQALASYTLTAFFVCMGIGSFFMGALSDKFGRKPVLICSILVAFTACILCAVSVNIAMLMVLRALHGLGSGGMVALGTTLAKDSFSGEQMARVLGFTQAVAMLAPIIAPLLGAAVVTYVGWRATFLVIAMGALCSLILTFFLKETVPRSARYEVSVGDVFKEMGHFVKKFNFMSLLVVGMCTSGPFMAYLGVASFVYEEFFGFTEFQFSMAFAATALFSIIGPLTFPKLLKRFTTYQLVGALLASAALCAILMNLFGQMSPIAFMVIMMLYAFIGATNRPLIANALLAPLTQGIGAASSLINFFMTIGGCLGMIIGAAGWDPVVAGLQCVMLAFVAVGVLLFAIILVHEKKTSSSR